MDELSYNLNIVSFDVPFPANYGGVIDVYYKLLWLHKAGVKIHLHCFTYGRKPSKELEALCEKVYYYERKTGNKSVPFINVAHDGWDSKRHDMLGSCIHFICPYDWTYVSVPIGLQHITNGKTSKNMAEQLSRMLSR